MRLMAPTRRLSSRADLLAVGLVLLHQVDGLVAHREADAFALQRGEDVVADVGVGDVVGARVDQPVAQLVRA
jgi:hypothetical protein